MAATDTGTAVPGEFERAPARRRRRRTGGAVVAVGVALVIGVGRFLAPPEQPPAYLDPRPEPDGEGYIQHVETALVRGVTPDQLREWMNQPGRDLDDIIESDPDAATAVVGQETIWGEWDATGDRSGDRRRVDFANGHFLAEEVLVDDGITFRYMIWGFTGPQRLAVRYGIGEFVLTFEADGARITWTYSFRPTAGVLRPVVTRFVESTMAPMMSATIEAMRAGAQAELT